MPTNAIALSSVGGGSKLHIVEVVVGSRERFGRTEPTYSQPSVYCGSDRGWGNHAWGVTELARFETVEYPDPRTDREGWSNALKVNGKAQRVAVVEAIAEVEKYGDRICAKCLKTYTTQRNRIVEAVMTEGVNEDIQALF
jgi:hypothetical protein